MSDIYIILHEIQQKLKAPKSQRNEFGKYNYRSCEDILEAVKPLLPKEYSLIMDDSVIECGGRIFLQARVSIRGEGSVSSIGLAEIAREQKGMQPAQITGSASSYARKYALNGLFCIDDTKDDDTRDNREQPKQQPQEKTPEYIFLENATKRLSEIQSEDELRKFTTDRNTNENIKNLSDKQMDYYN